MSFDVPWLTTTIWPDNSAIVSCSGSLLAVPLATTIYKPFSDAVDKNELEIDFNGVTLEELLKLLIDKYPKLKTEFYKKNNELSENICIFINDKPVSALNGTNTNLKNDDEIIFLIPHRRVVWN